MPQVHLNALTISIDGFDAAWSSEQKFDAQATWYRAFMQACVDSPACVDFEPYGDTSSLIVTFGAWCLVPNPYFSGSWYVCMYIKLILRDPLRIDR